VVILLVATNHENKLAHGENASEQNQSCSDADFVQEQTTENWENHVWRGVDSV